MMREFACEELDRLTSNTRPDTKAPLTLLLRAFIAQGLVLYLFYALPAQRAEVIALELMLIATQLSEGCMRMLGKPDQATFVLFASTNFASAYAAYLTGGAGSPILPWALAACIASLVAFRNTPPKLAAACGAAALGFSVAYLVQPSIPGISPHIAATLLIACPSAALAYLLASSIIRHWSKEDRAGHRNSEKARLEQLAHEAEAADRQTTKFFTEANHAIRTPLDAIIGYSEMILEDGGDAFNAGNLGDVERIQQATGQMLKLVSDVFDLSEIEKRQTASETAKFSAPEAISVADINNPSRAFG